MPYFTCPANPSRRSQVSALDPAFQRFLSHILQDASDSNEPGETKTDSSTAAPRHSPGSAMRKYSTFTPNFDVIETEDSYYLEGELPGVVDTRNVEIEVSDNALAIRGRIEKSKPVSAPVANPPIANEEAPKELKRRSLNPTVEDTDDEDDFSVISSTSKASEKKISKASVENDDQKMQQSVDNKLQEPVSANKIWLSERSFGGFQRCFSFPTRVDPDGVTAKLEHGVLAIKVPKVLFSGPRKVHIS